MNHIVESMLDRYEAGRITRRQLVQGLAAFACAAQAAPAEPVFPAKTLNHVTLSVSDIDRSKNFYQKIFGLPVLRQTEKGCNLGLGTSFLGLFRFPTSGAVDHVCIGIQDFQVEPVAAKLRQNGLSPEVEAGQVYFRDPDNIRIQLADADYRG